MNCFISSVLRNNLCPCCRTELYENDNDSNTNTESVNDNHSMYSEDGYPYHDNTRYSDYYRENDYEGGEDEEDDPDPFPVRDDNDPIASIEEISRQLQEKGITMIDLIHLLIPGRYPQNNIHTTENGLYNYIHKTLTDIVERADFDTKLEHYERKIMEKEDYRT